VLKRDAVAKVVLNNLYKHTQLQETFGANMLALVDGVPRTLRLDQMIRYWVAHQIEVIIRRTRFRLRKAQERLHIVAALLASHEPELNWLAVRNRILTGVNPDESATITGGHIDAYKALTPTGQQIVRRLHPDRDTLTITGNVWLSVLSIKGDGPIQPQPVTVEPGGATIELHDDGMFPDDRGDGVYTALWPRPGTDQLKLHFPDGSVVTIEAPP